MEIALMGELSARALEIKETRGYVVDGRCRDTDFILEMGFPVFCDLNTPADIVERWTHDRLGEPITIGAVTIQSGDYLIGDRDGVVIIPGDVVEEAVTNTEEVMSTESEMRDAILSGMDPEAAYLKYGKF
jgi:regulator of RNase E activity RraA